MNGWLTLGFERSWAHPSNKNDHHRDKTSNLDQSRGHIHWDMTVRSHPSKKFRRWRRWVHNGQVSSCSGKSSQNDCKRDRTEAEKRVCYTETKAHLDQSDHFGVQFCWMDALKTILQQRGLNKLFPSASGRCARNMWQNLRCKVHQVLSRCESRKWYVHFI